MTAKTLTLTGVAQHLGFSRKTIYQMIQSRRFDVRPVPRVMPRRWNVEDVDAWRKGDPYPAIGD